MPADTLAVSSLIACKAKRQLDNQDYSISEKETNGFINYSSRASIQNSKSPIDSGKLSDLGQKMNSSEGFILKLPKK